MSIIYWHAIRLDYEHQSAFHVLSLDVPVYDVKGRRLTRLAISKPTSQYEDRLILFVDFLGFKEVVRTTASDPTALRHLINALNEIGSIGGMPEVSSQRVTQFSDSVVLSYAVNEKSGVFWMINEIALTVISLVFRGYLLRGAVTIGPLYHDDRHVVGPAMVTAVEMESKIACFPRVIVDPAVIRLARRHRREGHSAHEEEQYVRSFISEDADGQLFIDYVSWNSVVAVAGAENEDYPEYLSRLSTMIKTGLAHDDVRVVEKYLWLYPRYVEVLKGFAEMPSDHPYRAQNWECCEAIGTLPTFKKIARDAKHRVKDAKKKQLPLKRTKP